MYSKLYQTRRAGQANGAHAKRLPSPSEPISSFASPRSVPSDFPKVTQSFASDIPSPKGSFGNGKLGSMMIPKAKEQERGRASNSPLKNSSGIHSNRSISSSRSPGSSYSPRRVFDDAAVEELNKKRKEMKEEARKNGKTVFIPEEMRIKNTIRKQNESDREDSPGKREETKQIGKDKRLDLADAKELKMILARKNGGEKVKVIHEKPETSNLKVEKGEKYIKEKRVDTIGLEVIPRPELVLTPIEKKEDFVFVNKLQERKFMLDQEKCKSRRRAEYANRNKTILRRVIKSEIDRLNERGTILARELGVNGSQVDDETVMKNPKLKALLDLRKKLEETKKEEEEIENQSSSESEIVEKIDKEVQFPPEMTLNEKLYTKSEMEALFEERLASHEQRFNEKIKAIKTRNARGAQTLFDPSLHSRQLREFREKERKAAVLIQFHYRQFKKQRAKKCTMETQTDPEMLKSLDDPAHSRKERPFSAKEAILNEENNLKGYFETVVCLGFVSQIASSPHKVQSWLQKA